MNNTSTDIKPEDTFTLNDLKALLQKAGDESATLASEAYLLGYHRALEAVQA